MFCSLKWLDFYLQGHKTLYFGLFCWKTKRSKFPIFHQKQWTNPSSETHGQSVGSGEKAARKFSLRAKEPLGTDSHRTISKNSSGCRLLIGHKKCFVLLCPIGEHFSMSSFRVFVHDGYCLDHGLSSLCTKEMHAVRKLSVWYKIPIWSNSLTLSNARELFRTISKFMKRMNFVIACLLLRKTWS